MCRYNYGGKYCAHRMIEHRECRGESNCLERVAPSYHSKRSAHVSEHAVKCGQAPLVAFSRSIDLRLIDLGLPLAQERM